MNTLLDGSLDLSAERTLRGSLDIDLVDDVKAYLISILHSRRDCASLLCLSHANKWFLSKIKPLLFDYTVTILSRTICSRNQILWWTEPLFVGTTLRRNWLNLAKVYMSAIRRRDTTLLSEFSVEGSFPTVKYNGLELYSMTVRCEVWITIGETCDLEFIEMFINDFLSAPTSTPYLRTLYIAQGIIQADNVGLFKFISGFGVPNHRSHPNFPSESTFGGGGAGYIGFIERLIELVLYYNAHNIHRLMLADGLLEKYRPYYELDPSQTREGILLWHGVGMGKTQSALARLTPSSGTRKTTSQTTAPYSSGPNIFNAPSPGRYNSASMFESMSSLYTAPSRGEDVKLIRDVCSYANYIVLHHLYEKSPDVVMDCIIALKSDVFSMTHIATAVDRYSALYVKSVRYDLAKCLIMCRIIWPLLSYTLDSDTMNLLMTKRIPYEFAELLFDLYINASQSIYRNCMYGQWHVDNVKHLLEFIDLQRGKEGISTGYPHEIRVFLAELLSVSDPRTSSTDFRKFNKYTSSADILKYVNTINRLVCTRIYLRYGRDLDAFLESVVIDAKTREVVILLFHKYLSSIGLGDKNI